MASVWKSKIVCIFLLFYLFTFLPLTAYAQAAPKVGLVLSGGGAKGAAEVGVLKVLEEQGIHVDCIAGTSIGAIVGALYSAGYKADELEKMFREQDWIPLLTDYREDLWSTPYKKVGSTHYVFGFPVYDEGNKGMGVLRANQIEQYIRDMLKAKKVETFKQLKTPFYCVATDLSKAEEVVFKEGDLTKAVRASMAIPAIFKTVDVDGRTLVDGGAVNNLPVDVLINNEHPDFIICIDLTQKEPTKDESVSETVRNIASYIQFLAQFVGLGNITEWLINQPQVERYYANKALLRADIDLYINPRLGNYSYSSFSKENISEMLRMGEESARDITVTKRLWKIAALQKAAKENASDSMFHDILNLGKSLIR